MSTEPSTDTPIATSTDTPITTRTLTPTATSTETPIIIPTRTNGPTGLDPVGEPVVFPLSKLYLPLVVQ